MCDDKCAFLHIIHQPNYCTLVKKRKGYIDKYEYNIKDQNSKHKMMHVCIQNIQDSSSCRKDKYTSHKAEEQLALQVVMPN
jgi:hypothetical protein